MDDGSGEMDEGGEALIGFVGAHGDAFEFFEFAEEILDQVAPFVHLVVDGQRLVRRGCWEMTILAPRWLRSAMMALLSKALSAIKPPKQTPLMSGATPTVSNRWPGSRHKAHKIAERVGEREDFGRHAALGAAYGLALSPPFAPWPWRWTLTMVASTMAYSMSGSSEQASKSRTKTSALTQPRYRVKTLFQLAEEGRQVPPRTSGANDPKHGLDEAAGCPYRFVRGPSACPDKAVPFSPIGRPSAQIVPSSA